MATDGITLYRGITPGTLGMDVHGGYGETWTRDFEQAKRYARSPKSYVLEAILLPSAKQLILTTEPDEEGFTDYVPEGIQTLANIVNDPWLYDSILSGRRCLWDVWKPEWTEAIIKAGYDSIFTSGFDGPEEYLLNPGALQLVRYYCVSTENHIEGYLIEPGMLDRLGYVVGLGITKSKTKTRILAQM
jgi:hypothetical protein